MPRATGKDVLIAARNNTAYKTTPFLLLSTSQVQATASQTIASAKATLSQDVAATAQQAQQSIDPKGRVWRRQQQDAVTLQNGAQVAQDLIHPLLDHKRNGGWA